MKTTGKTVKRRLPSYLAGFLFGIVAVLLIMQGKKAFAPKFLDTKDERGTLRMATGGTLRLRYVAEPGRNLVPGFPSELALGRQNSDGTFQQIGRLQYRALTEPDIVLGPLETGRYEIRGALYSCDAPGVAVCARILLVQGLEVAPEKQLSNEVSVLLDLGAAAKQALESAPPK